MPRFTAKVIGDWVLIAGSLGTLLGTIGLVVVGAYTLIGTESIDRPPAEGPGELLDAGVVSAARAVELVEFVEETCPACHGKELHGSVGPPLSRAELQHLTVNALTMTLLQGRPEKGMPPWNGQLSKTDALWIAEFLKGGGYPEQRRRSSP